MDFFSDNFSLIIFIICLIIALLVITRIVRFIYNFIRYLYLSYKYRPRFDRQTNKYHKKHTSLPDSPVERDLEAELKLKEDLQKLNANKELIKINDRKIVGIAEPIGMWTEFVTKQKLSWLKAMIGSKADSDMFWQNIIEAQARAQGKQKSRGPGR